MADLKLDIDPRKIIQSMNQISEATKKLSEQLNASLGREAVDAVDKLETKAENGASFISSRFSDMSKTIQQNLKTAFNIGALAEGLKIGNLISQGVREVFNLERAFDKLNTRLGLTGQRFQDFKRDLGTSVANTGQDLNDIFPGVEEASARGNIKDPNQLAQIGGLLAQAKAATGEDTKSLAATIADILKTQGIKLDATSFKATLDALQGGRVAGNFGSANEVGSSINAITKDLRPDQLKAMGLDSRSLVALSSQASLAGAGGTNVLNRLLVQGGDVAGRERLNAVIPGLYNKQGKFDSKALTNIDQKKFGEYTSQILGEYIGVGQAELSRVFDSFKGGMGNYKKVIDGADETSKQFQTSTDNLASKMDKFRMRTVNAVRLIGEDLSKATSNALDRNFKGAKGAVKDAGDALWDNKGTLTLAALGTLILGMVTGSAAGSLLKTAGGVGIAKATGVQPVFVTNMPLGGLGGGLGAAASGAIAVGEAGVLALVSGVVGSVLAGGVAGVAVGNTEEGKKIADSLIDQVMSFGKGFKESMKSSPTQESHEALAKAIGQEHEAAIIRARKSDPVKLSNPSVPKGTGRSM